MCEEVSLSVTEEGGWCRVAQQQNTAAQFAQGQKVLSARSAETLGIILSDF